MQPTVWQLFIRSFTLSGTTVGGGFVILSAMERLYVRRLGWLTREEMLDITALAQSAPGAVAVNASLLTGAKLRGTVGAAASLIGCILPPFGIMCILGAVYRFLRNSTVLTFLLPFFRIAVGILLLRITLSLCRRNLNTPYTICIFTAALTGILCFHVDSVWFLLGAAGMTILLYFRRKKQ
ncbi:MAG: chromate transporter [Clostridia bacterium]|nr:chromate transporter [Clostridia bacterium]